jgi:sigma-70-like protein
VRRWAGRGAATPPRSAPSTATPSPACCATCTPWSATTPRTSPQKPGCRSPATCTPSTAPPTASAAGPPPSPATAPSTTCAPAPAAPPPIPLPAEDLATLAAADDTAARALDAVATRAAVALIATLPPDQAEAVLLRAVIGLDATTAAHVLGKRPGAIRTAAYRGLHTLARHLNHAESASPP